jgi:hypothetical protein
MPLVLTRRQTAQLLNVSISKLIRMEQAGDLTPLHLHSAAVGQVHHAYSDVISLVEKRRAASGR